MRDMDPSNGRRHRRGSLGRTLAPALVGVMLLSRMGGTPALRAQSSDLDELMERVISTRDDSWRLMRQYVLDEHETLRVVGSAGDPIYGFSRDYTWFIKQGIFVRSPVRADGAAIADAERRAAENEWIRREQRRLDEPDASKEDAGLNAASLDAILDPTLQPRFVSAAYFLKFRFDPGRYALAGHETLDGRDVLRIEYYPTRLFESGRSRPSRRARERDPNIRARLNKATLVTLWVDPEAAQIRRYRADGLDWSFLPGRSLVRVDEVTASMSMQEAFPGVWLPDTVEMRFGLSLALGDVTGRYGVQYHDYRLADVTSAVRPGRP